MLLIDGATSHLQPFLVQSRQLDLLYHVEHWKGCLIILANTGPEQEYQVEFLLHTFKVHKLNEKHVTRVALKLLDVENCS